MAACSRDASLKALEQSQKLVAQRVIVKTAVRLVDKSGLLNGLIEQRRPRYQWLFLIPTCRECACVVRRLPAFLCCLPRFDFLGHGFSPFLSRLSRGTQKRMGPARKAKGCFL